MAAKSEDVGALGPHLQIDVFPAGEDRVLVVVEGEIDLPEVGELRAILNDVIGGGAPEVVVDLGAVRFIGSSGLGVLIGAHNDLTATGRRLIVRGAAPGIRKAFGITGLDKVLEVE